MFSVLGELLRSTNRETQWSSFRRMSQSLFHDDPILLHLLFSILDFSQSSGRTDSQALLIGVLSKPNFRLCHLDVSHCACICSKALVSLSV